MANARPGHYRPFTAHGSAMHLRQCPKVGCPKVQFFFHSYIPHKVPFVSKHVNIHLVVFNGVNIHLVVCKGDRKVSNFLT